ncbi:MAG: VCBS repeat-containing protein, partial [Ignavibacteriaceae bacterium]|nr:VCBS repeat-containing protein [Ignavibacteriaceae bacterium]
GTFGRPISYTLEDKPIALINGDFNLDGRLDLAAVNYGGNSVSILLKKVANNTALFEAQTDYPVGDWPKGLASGDLNNDGKKELIMVFINNGLERVGCFVVGLNNISGQTPSSKEYMFYKNSIQMFMQLILVPNTDLNKYFGHRFAGIYEGIDDLEDQREIFFSTNETSSALLIIWYKINYNFHDFKIVVTDNFRVARDLLVRDGKLNYPLSDTKEYTELLKSQILFWNGEKFVKREELK